MFEDLSDKEIRKFAKDDEQFRRFKEMAKRDRKREEMDIQELLEKETDEPVLEVTPSNTNSGYMWVYLDYDETPSNREYDSKDIEGVIDSIVSWHEMSRLIREFTEYELDTSSYRVKDTEKHGKVLAATLKPA